MRLDAALLSYDISDFTNERNYDTLEIQLFPEILIEIEDYRCEPNSKPPIQNRHFLIPHRGTPGLQGKPPIRPHNLKGEWPYRLSAITYLQYTVYM